MPFGFGGHSSAGQVDAGAIMSRFAAAFPPDKGAIRAGAGMWKPIDTRKLLGQDDPAFTALIGAVTTSHCGGLLRFFLPSTRPSLVEWNDKHGWHESWPSRSKSIAFASDWMGNLLVIDPSRGPSGLRRVAFLDIITGAYDVDGELTEFIAGLPDTWESVLFKREFDEYVAAGGQRPGISECVGYVTPPVMGADLGDVGTRKVVTLEAAVAGAGRIHGAIGGEDPIAARLARYVSS